MPDAGVAQTLLQDRDRQALEAGRLHQPLDRAGRPRGHAAAAGRQPTPPSPTAARSCSRTSGSSRRRRRADGARPRAGRRRARSTSRRTTLDVVRAASTRRRTRRRTSAPVFAGYPVDVAGKTGTAEVCDGGRMVDYAWYASYAPSDDPKYAVVVMIEKGGHGGTTAAPATRMIYDALFHVDSGKFTGDRHGATDCRLARLPPAPRLPAAPGDRRAHRVRRHDGLLRHAQRHRRRAALLRAPAAHRRRGGARRGRGRVAARLRDLPPLPVGAVRARRAHRRRRAAARRERQRRPPLDRPRRSRASSRRRRPCCCWR